MTSKRARPARARSAFEDVGFPPHEAAHLTVRADLMLALRRLMAERELTQVDAARLFGVSQPRVSDLARGRIDRFSIDALVEMLGRAGVSARITLRPGRIVA